MAVFLARIVMPRSRSSSFESITRSTWCSLERKVPLCCSMASTRVVLPWSTCAMMAILRMPELKRNPSSFCVYYHFTMGGRKSAIKAPAGNAVPIPSSLQSVREKESIMKAAKKGITILLKTGIVIAAALPQVPSNAAVTRSEAQFGPGNPFYAASTLPLQAPPFDKIKDSDYQPALEAGMAQQREEVR